MELYSDKGGFLLEKKQKTKNTTLKNTYISLSHLKLCPGTSTCRFCSKFSESRTSSNEIVIK